MFGNALALLRGPRKADRPVPVNSPVPWRPGAELWVSQADGVGYFCATEIKGKPEKPLCLLLTER